MKQFRQLVKELPTRKVVFAIGRFQPPSAMHENMINAVKKIAENKQADHLIFASTSDKKSDPLTLERKMYYLKRMFPNVHFAEEAKTLAETISALRRKYKDITIVVPNDRLLETKKLCDKHNVEVVAISEIDADSSNPIRNKLLESAKKNDFSTFKNSMPFSLTELDSKRLMNDIRQGFGLEIIKEQIKFETDDVREKYFAGEIFHVGDIVESNDVVYRILKRGSNHLLIEDEQGNKISKWPQDLQVSTKEFKQELDEMVIKSADKLKVARIIASSLGMANVDEKTGAEEMVNVSLRKIKSKNLSPEAWKILGNMLKLATDAGIKYDAAIIPETKFKVMGLEEEADLQDSDIDEMINEMSEDDYLEAYDDNELALVDEDTGEFISDLEEVILEGLSRAERIKAKVRFARTEAKRERKIKIALKSHATTATVNKRARRLAIITMKKRLAKKPLDKLSLSDKERIEGIIAKRKKIVDRIAMRLVPKIKKIESDRLTHKNYTK